MSKVASLTGDNVRGLEPDPLLIEALEDALERARSGNVIAVAIAEVHASGATDHTWTGAVPISLLGELTRLSWRLSEKVQ